MKIIKAWAVNRTALELIQEDVCKQYCKQSNYKNVRNYNIRPKDRWNNHSN